MSTQLATDMFHKDRCCFLGHLWPGSEGGAIFAQAQGLGVGANGHTMPKEDLRPRDSSGLNMALFKARGW